jgi:hypothetical protein
VAIVGNAQSIFATHHGSAIDDHDVVIRFNRGFVSNKDAQGSKTDILILACELRAEEVAQFNAVYVLNRSNKTKCGDVTFRNIIRRKLKQKTGAQPSSGFMAIWLCRYAKAKKIDLFGFDFEHTPTFYNPVGYVSKHNYNAEEKFVRGLAEKGIVRIN